MGVLGWDLACMDSLESPHDKPIKVTLYEVQRTTFVLGAPAGCCGPGWAVGSDCHRPSRRRSPLIMGRISGLGGGIACVAAPQIAQVLLVHALPQPMRGNPFLAPLYRSAAMQGAPVQILL
jgi:hypothetical protein